MHFPDLSGVIGGLAGAFIATWLLGRVAPHATPGADGAKVLRYHLVYAIIGWVGLVIFLGFSVAVIMSDEPPRVLWFCIPVFGGFALLSVVMLLIYRRCSLVVGADAIRYSPLWGKPFTFTWSDIESVRFSGTAQWWRLRLRDRRTVRVSTYMNGAGEFMATLAARTHLQIPPAILPNGRTLDVVDTKDP